MVGIEMLDEQHAENVELYQDHLKRIQVAQAEEFLN